MKTAEISDLRILLLEDSEIDAALIIREIRNREIFFVHERVQTRSEFIRAIGEFRPELILADYNLPGFDGGQALALARECCPDVPVIIVSGAVGEEKAVELLKEGATDFVLKDRLRGRLVLAIYRAMREVAERDSRRQAEVALSVLNAQLEQRVAERTRELAAHYSFMKEDLNLARELQTTLMPDHFPTLPRSAGSSTSAVKFSSIMHPTDSVSGDYCSVVSVSDTAVGIFMCDVMGHGVRAALVAAMMRALEDQLGHLRGDPGALLTQMNRSLRSILGHLDTTLYTTACYVLVDVATGRLILANAGHPCPLILRDLTGEVEVISNRNPALGLFDDVEYLTREFPVAAGDLIFVFTDGLFNVTNAKSEPYGIMRLRDSIYRQAGTPLSELAQNVFTEIENFAEGRTFPDDVCLIGMEVTRLETDLRSPPQPLKGNVLPAMAAIS